MGNLGTLHWLHDEIFNLKLKLCSRLHIVTLFLYLVSIVWTPTKIETVIIE